MKTLLPTPLKYQKNKLTFDGQDLKKILLLKLRKFKIPLYLYSKKTIIKTYGIFEKEALKAKIPSPLICYAVKANANPEVLKLLKSCGAGADIVSGGVLS